MNCHEQQTGTGEHYFKRLQMQALHQNAHRAEID